MSRLVDLSMPVHRDMVTFPRINPPQMLMFDSWEDFATGVGAVWTVLWFLIGGWVSTLLQIIVLIGVVYLLKYGWQRALPG